MWELSLYLKIKNPTEIHRKFVSATHRPKFFNWPLRLKNTVFSPILCRPSAGLLQVSPFEDHPSHKAIIQVLTEGKRKDWWKLKVGYYPCLALLQQMFDANLFEL